MSNITSNFSLNERGDIILSGGTLDQFTLLNEVYVLTVTEKSQGLVSVQAIIHILRPLAPPLRWRGIFSSLNVLVVPINYQDVRIQTTQEEFEKNFFETNLNDDRYTVAEYFLLNSDGQFEISGHVLPTNAVILTNTKAHYHAGRGWLDSAMPEITDQVLTYLDSVTGLVKSDYDVNNDRYIDAICYIYAGGVEGSVPVGYRTGWISPRGVSGSSLDGLWLNDYTMQTEAYHEGQSNVFDRFPIGISCHELGHILGFPDLNKDVNYGDLALMSYGGWGKKTDTTLPGTCPAPLIGLHKIMLGWLEPIVIDKDSQDTYVIGDYSDTNASNKIYKVVTDNPDEYWLIENRQGTHFDAAFRGKGLLIWHIKDSLIKTGTSIAVYISIYDFPQGQMPFALQFEDPRVDVAHPINFLLGTVTQDHFWNNDPIGLAPTTTPSTQYANTTNHSGLHIRNIQPIEGTKNMQFEVFFEDPEDIEDAEEE